MRRSAPLWTVTCFLWLLAGCLERPGTPIGPEVGFGQQVSIDPGGVNAIDILFVIDNSGSMYQEQENLAVQIPALVRDLASPPDRDGDGAPDWAAAESLRIAIANTDTGIGSVVIPGSRCMPGGDGGVLHGGVFEWNTGDDPDAFAAAVGSVVAGLGITGCGFEQQLEAAAVALELNATRGFPREDALLGIIVVTDEEDCSTEHDDSFFSAVDPRTYDVHCTRNAASLTPVASLLERIRGDRTDDRIVFAAIAGVPVDLPAGATPAEILELPDMQYRETADLQLEPVCGDSDGLGEAAPARRLVDLASMLPGSVVTTICTDDFGPAIAEIAARIGERIQGVCLARALPDTADGAAPCEVFVHLPPGDRCDAVAAYGLHEIDREGREVCSVTQVEPGASSGGWYYDPSDASCPRLVLTPDAQPPLGAELTAECFFHVLREFGEQCARGSQCKSGYCDLEAQVCAPLPEVPGGSGSPTG